MDNPFGNVDDSCVYSQLQKFQQYAMDACELADAPVNDLEPVDSFRTRNAKRIFA
jgi:hypothetical protein